MAAAVTGHMELFLSELRTNNTLQADFTANPANAVAPFELTPHERRAILTKDCNDLLALELTNLPPLLGCGGGGGGGIADILDALRARLKELLDRRRKPPDLDEPIPPIPPPDLEPQPPPGRGPLPGPRPGPDPPDLGRPDRPAPGRPTPGRPPGPDG
jgi:hypothetical protein